MAKITTEQARKITTSNSNGYFSLKNDKDTARVKFMYNKIDEIETFAVHEVDVNGFTRHVDCLKDADGNGSCPFCDKGIKLTARTFFKVYNVEKDAAEVWDCGIKRAPTVENMISSRSENIVNDCYQITRNGKPKDPATSYDIIYVGKDDITLDDLPKAPEIYGKYVLKKTAAEMEYYIANNKFPEANNTNTTEEAPKKRNNRMAF